MCVDADMLVSVGTYLRRNLLATRGNLEVGRLIYTLYVAQYNSFIGKQWNTGR